MSVAAQASASVTARVQRVLGRIAAENAETSVFVSLAPAAALRDAAASDRRRQHGESLGPMDGVLVGVKDNIAVAGLPRTAGTGLFKDQPQRADAPSVAALRRGGAIILGTLNMHEGALGATTDNPFHGRCRNPLDPSRTPGGSSGGSGAAVAAGLVDLALGSDTMGSVRIPAAYCGTLGLKPTDGLIGRDGMFLLSEQLDCIGVLSQDPDVLLAALEAMAGPGSDRLALDAPQGWPGTGGSLSGLRVLIPEAVAGVAADPQQMAAMERAADFLADQGAILERAALPGWLPGLDRRAGLLLIEADGARLLSGVLARPEETGISRDFRAMLEFGARSTAPKLTAALALIRATGAALHRALARHDLILTPTAPQRAFPFDTPVPANQADFTSMANFAGLPALSLPVALAGETLPGAVQLIARPWHEAQLAMIAAATAPLRLSQGANP